MNGLIVNDDDDLIFVPGFPSGSQNSVYQEIEVRDFDGSMVHGDHVHADYVITSLPVGGDVTPVFFDDWYNRIHLMPMQIDLSNIITDQTRPILLWNAYLEDKDLMSTNFPAAQGMSVTSPVVPPYTIRPLETLTYTVNVSADGPPVIDVKLTWVIDGESDLVVGITGRRIVVWPFAPDWSTPVVESLDWMTDVMVSYYGNEQREQLRGKPRRQFEYTSLITKQDTATAANLLWGWQNRNFALPLWYDRTRLNSSVIAGDVTLNVDTTNRGFFNGGLLFIMKDTMTYEAVEIESFNSSSVTLAKPVEQSWAPGTAVYPVNISLMPMSVPRRMITDGVSQISVTFTADPIQTDPFIPAGTAPLTYNGYEVITKKPNWAQPIDVTNEFEYDLTDFQTGGFRANPTRQYPQVVRRFQWVFKNRTRAIEFRKLLGRLKGRLKAAYLPTWFSDFELYATEVASSPNIRVKSNEFNRMVGVDSTLNTLMIVLRSGTVIFKTIGAVGTDPLDFTTLGLDSAIGYDLNSTTLARLSLVHLCRLSSDRVTINHLSDGVSTVEANFTLVRA